jgi:hypothetical protein
MIFANPSGAPELACNECGCRWFDRMTDRCYECGAEIGQRDIAEFEAALQSFATGKRPAPAKPQRDGSAEPECGGPARKTPATGQ